MPSFVANGPVVPEELIQDLEDDRVVLFCGAGISKGAGLPDYVGLVQQVYKQVGAPLPCECDRSWDWPDRMLGDLEARFSSSVVRTAIRKVIEKKPLDLKYHTALLRLSQLNRCEGRRLVTTNFDTYFEQADPALRPGLDLHSAPILPIPRDDENASWRSLVHLHGRVEAAPHPNDHLIVTSADFGRAYLTEGWAARFVTRLFADFSVLFIGYSLNDPVLRYMTDAFAADALADRQQSPRPRAYIFAPCGEDTAPPSDAWSKRGLKPIFYRQADHHKALRDTIVAWAAARDDWLSNTADLVERLASQEPDVLTPNDLSNVLWAVSGQRRDHGYGAKVFSQLQPAPPIGWLHSLEKYENELLAAHRGALTEKPSSGAPPAPPVLDLGSLMLRAQTGAGLSPAALNLGKWLVQHLDNEELIDWVAGHAQNDRRMHPDMRGLVRRRLAKGNAGLNKAKVRFWEIVSSEGVWTHNAQESHRAADVCIALKDHADDAVARAELLSLLRPFLRLSPNRRMPWADIMGVTDPEQRRAMEARFDYVAEAEVDLVGGDELQFALDAIGDVALGAIADDITSLLKEALDLWAVVDKADTIADPSRYHRPSIRPHAQNRSFSHRWTILIDLLWRGWKHLDSQQSSASRQLVDRWRTLSYPTFKRMALQAIEESSLWTPQEKLDALLDGSALWDKAQRKEAFDLITTLWPKLDEAGQDRLVARILEGPPKSALGDRADEDKELGQWQHDRAVFERLAVLRRTTSPGLPRHALAKLAALELEYPKWEIEPSDRAHFAMWMESPYYLGSDRSEGELASLSGAALLDVLRKPGNKQEGRLDTWRNAVRARPGRGIGLLRMLAANPADGDADLWRHTLFGLRDAISRPAVRRRLFETLAKTPDQYLSLQTALPAACDLLNQASKQHPLEIDEGLFWRVWDRLFLKAVDKHDASELTANLDHDDKWVDDSPLPARDDDWVHQALNQPLGDLATALCNVTFRRGLQAGQGLPEDLRSRFDLLIAPSPDGLRLSRVILASRLVYLFAVDPAWTRDRLIPFFDWDSSEGDAVAVWQGYAYNARINAGLWEVLRPYFFNTFTAEHLAAVGSSAENLACLLMVVGVEVHSAEPPADSVREAIRTLTPELRAETVTWLRRHVAGPKADTPEKEEERAARADRLWRKRVGPWLIQAWPRDRRLIEPGTSELFALLAIATADAFKEAVDALKPFIGKGDSWSHAIRDLNSSSHPDRHPQSSLDLLDRLVTPQGSCSLKEFRAVLDRIIAADRTLRNDPAFRTLDQWLRPQE